MKSSNSYHFFMLWTILFKNFSQKINRALKSECFTILKSFSISHYYEITFEKTEIMSKI